MKRAMLLSVAVGTVTAVFAAGVQPGKGLGLSTNQVHCTIGTGKRRLGPISKVRVSIPQLEDGVTCRLDGVVRGGGEQVEVDSGKEYEYVYSRKNHIDQKGSFSAKGGELKELPSPQKPWKVNPKFEEWCQAKCQDAVQGLDSGFGLVCLETYHEMYVEGYTLKSDDREIVEEAWKRCIEEFERTIHNVVGGNNAAAKAAYLKARRLYNELIGKRATVEDGTRKADVQGKGKRKD